MLTLCDAFSSALPGVLASVSLLWSSGATFVACFSAGKVLIWVYIWSTYRGVLITAYTDFFISNDRELIVMDRELTVMEVLLNVRQILFGIFR